MKPIRLLTVLGLCFSIVALGQLCWGDTVAELRAALEPYPATAPVFVETAIGVKPAAVEARDGAAVIVAEGIVPLPPDSMLSPFGLYQALQPGAHSPPKDLSPPKGTRLIGVDELNLLMVRGFTCRVRPPWLGTNEPRDFSFIDANLARANSTGDVMNLLVMSGGDISESNLRWFEIAAAKLGERYNGKPGLAGVHVTGASSPGASEEQHWSRVTPQVQVANERMMRAWANAFPDHWLIYAVGGGDIEGKKKLIDAMDRIAPDRVAIKHNSLKASSSIDADHFKLLAYAINKKMRVGFEMVGDSSEERFGEGGIMAGINKGVEFLRRHNYKPQDAYWAVYPLDLAKLGAIK